MRRVATLLALAVLAAGCGQASDAVAPKQTRSDPEPTPHKVSVVVTTKMHWQDEMIYIEGALQEVALVDANGHRFTAEPAMNGPFRFDHLSPGTYELHGALRPCDGNCGILDGRVDRCHTTLEVASDLEAQVSFTIGQPCVITTD